MKGMFTAMKEFAEPFISESIWTEAAFDIIARQGRSREGFEIYNQKDTAGNKAKKIMAHLVKAQMPFSAPQLKRLFSTEFSTHGLNGVVGGARRNCAAPYI